MTTGWGLSAGRLLAACALFVRADYGQWAEESDDGERKPLRQFAGKQAARPEPTADPPTALGR